MTKSALPRKWIIFLLLGLGALILAGLALWIWQHRQRLPQPGSISYEEYVEAFEIGTAALDSGLWPRAEENLTIAIDKIAQEPAGWANRGLLYLRTNQLDKAAHDLHQARNLAPKNGDIEEMLGYLAEYNGKLDEAVKLFESASQADPEDVRRQYKLLQLLEKQGQVADEERKRLVLKLLDLRPTSLPLLMERLRIAVGARDRQALEASLARLEQLSREWKPPTQEMLKKVRQGVQGEYEITETNLLVGLLHNLVRAETGYTRSMDELSPDSRQVGRSLQQFLRLAPMQTDPSLPDLQLAFTRSEIKEIDEVIKKEPRALLLPFWLNEDRAPILLIATAREVRQQAKEGLRLPFPSGPSEVQPSREGVLALDWNNDHRSDLLLVGAGGLRFHEQRDKETFVEITSATKLTPEILQGDYYGAWAMDIDLDGDLDVVLARRKGAPVLLRNNDDGTFLAQPIFPNVDNLRSLAWADIDNDGAADVLLLDAQGKLHLFMNERLGQYRRRELPADLPRMAALTILDTNEDGRFDLVTLTQNGKLLRLIDKEKGKDWELNELVSITDPLPLTPETARLLTVDLDLNGAIDIVLRTPEGGVAWLADGKGTFERLPTQIPGGVSELFPSEQGGSWHLYGWEDKLPARWKIEGTKKYHWCQFRARSDPKGTGGQRVNSFALGSELELRSGTLVVKVPVNQSVLQLGLGTRQRPTVIRCVWTSGALQFEFDKQSNQTIKVVQRLTGSCPFLFTWDGEKIVFVTDFCWSTPLGLFINAQKAAGGFGETSEWVRIRGEQLRPRDGYYDVRVQANLWETHFLDQLALRVIDHPPGTEIFCDERLFLTPTKPRLYVTDLPQPVARAWDHHGQEVTDLVRTIDSNFLDRAGRGAFRGVTKDHWVEFALDEKQRKQTPLYLLAHGWVQPTDSSINAALEQSSHPRPVPLTLEIPDGQGGWKVARAALGFPAGKNKTVVLRLDDLGESTLPSRFRLRTNMEIYWDALHLAREVDASQIVQHILTPEYADLRFHGIVRMSRANSSSPEIPHYQDIECGHQYWRDLIGYHTRFGDVVELLEKVDDRYVILNAGDEIRLRFRVPPPPPAGWKRDFVWVSDGWTKDGNISTTFSKTVLPLPWHGMTNYDTPPGRLEDDPVYQKHVRDWQTFHTRFISPEVFERGLRPWPQAHRR